jgi:hypothetical protein
MLAMRSLFFSLCIVISRVCAYAMTLPTSISRGDRSRKIRLTHRNRQCADGYLYTCNDDEDVLDATLHHPLEALERQAEGEDVLENEEAGEAFDGHVACTYQHHTNYRTVPQNTIVEDGKKLTYDTHPQHTTHLPRPRTPSPQPRLQTTHSLLPTPGSPADRHLAHTTQTHTTLHTPTPIVVRPAPI